MSDRFDLTVDGAQLAKLLGPRCPQCGAPAEALRAKGDYLTCECGMFYGLGSPYEIFRDRDCDGIPTDGDEVVVRWGTRIQVYKREDHGFAMTYRYDITAEEARGGWWGKDGGAQRSARVVAPDGFVIDWDACDRYKVLCFKRVGE